MIATQRWCRAHNQGAARLWPTLAGGEDYSSMTRMHVNGVVGCTSASAVVTLFRQQHIPDVAVNRGSCSRGLARNFRDRF